MFAAVTAGLRAAPRWPPSDPNPTDRMRSATLTLPLRGMAGPDVQAAVDRALAGVDGVLAARADVASFRLHVEYDDARVAPAAIHDALARAGIGHAAHATSEAPIAAPARPADTPSVRPSAAAPPTTR